MKADHPSASALSCAHYKGGGWLQGIGGHHRRPLIWIGHLARAVVTVAAMAGMAPVVHAATVYTLYRNSVLDANMRIHVATFDADSGDAYNRDNCDLARSLFQAQPGARTRFWCEVGGFRR